MANEPTKPTFLKKNVDAVPERLHPDSKEPDTIVFDTLSLDGGGIRGFFQLLYLRDHVDQILNVKYIFGTSIGGIVGLEVARLLVETKRNKSKVKEGIEKLITIFTEQGESIFDRNKFFNVLDASTYVYAKYTSNELKKIMVDMWGDNTLAMFNKQPSKDKPDEDFEIRVFITAFDLTRMKPTVFKNCDEEHKNISLVDVGLSTSAAPTYFPMHTFDRPVKHAGAETTETHKSQMVDGGVWANNPIPTMIGLRKNCKGARIILSLGTGFVHVKDTDVFPPQKDDQGLRFWMIHGSDEWAILHGHKNSGLLINLMFAGQAYSGTRNVATTVYFRKDRYLRRVNFKMDQQYELDSLGTVTPEVLNKITVVIREIASKSRGHKRHKGDSPAHDNHNDGDSDDDDDKAHEEFSDLLDRILQAS